MAIEKPVWVEGEILSAEKLNQTEQFLEENEQVFNGDLVYEINKITAESFTIGSAMRLQDQKTNGNPPNFDMHF